MLPSSLPLFLPTVLGKASVGGSDSNNCNGKDGEGDEGEDDGGWVQRIDVATWEQYTSDPRYKQAYDTNKVAHLLHFTRNASQHPPPARSAMAAAFAA